MRFQVSTRFQAKHFRMFEKMFKWIVIIYLQKSTSMQSRTIPPKFGGGYWDTAYLPEDTGILGHPPKHTWINSTANSFCLKSCNFSVISFKSVDRAIGCATSPPATSAVYLNKLRLEGREGSRFLLRLFWDRCSRSEKIVASLTVSQCLFVHRLERFPHEIDNWLLLYCQGTRMRWDSPACGRSYQRLHGCTLTGRHASTSEEISPEKQAKVARISDVSKLGVRRTGPIKNTTAQIIRSWWWPRPFSSKMLLFRGGVRAEVKFQEIYLAEF